ncbi:hypothetical protein FACS1894103_3070 [Campylobacterota bacterium]|nr:hypothetical protein FACS1894103_3070 [Campylobacterota bacterium]
MAIDYDHILKLPNKQFIPECFKLIQSWDISDSDFKALTDVDIANAVIKPQHRYTYPIVVEVAIDEEVTQAITHIKKRRRYYDNIFEYKGKRYLLCNDWYYPPRSKKNTKDTRTEFIEWLKRMETK